MRQCLTNMVKNAPDEITLWLSSTQWHAIHHKQNTKKKYGNEATVKVQQWWCLSHMEFSTVFQVWSSTFCPRSSDYCPLLWDSGYSLSPFFLGKELDWFT